MTAADGPSDIDRRRYGDTLARAIHLVRTGGTPVAPYKNGLFRVGDGAAMHVCSAADIHGMAAKVTRPKPDAPRARMARHEITKTAAGTPPGGREGTVAASGPGISPAKYICASCGGPRSKWSKTLCATCYAQVGRGSYPAQPTADVRDKFWHAVEPSTAGPEQGAASNSPPPDDAPQAARIEEPTATPAPAVGASAGTDLCGCGRPRLPAHGRCWAIRGLPGPLEKRAVGRPLPKVCEKCGGPRSYWSARLCQKCYRPEPPAPRPSQEGRITSLEAELAATKADFAAFKDTVKAAVADLVAHLGLGEDR